MDAVRHGWRQLFGSISKIGLSVEMHRFRCRERLDWQRSFHDNSVELCLNLQGEGLVLDGSKEFKFGTNTAGFYVVTRSGLTAWREPGDHFFVTIELRPDFFHKQAAYDPMSLQPEICSWLNGTRPPVRVGGLRPMSMFEVELSTSLTNPPVAEACRALWYHGKIMELMAHFLFCAVKPADFFCSRQKRTAQERVEQVVTLLRANLESPPDLGELGKVVGCSSFYLSRIFSEQKGMTISQYLKRMRIEKAAEMLRGGSHNVTEAAMTVGYSSLSHFSKAFAEVMGVPPAAFASGGVKSGA